MYPVLWEPFGFAISSFGVMMAIGFLVSERIVARRLGEQGLDRDLSSTILVYAVLCGVIGAKLYFAIDSAVRGERFFFDALFDRAGMTWFGGLMAGVLGVTIATRIHRVPTAAVAAAVANAAPFGQLFGRIGCFLVGDDYGRPTDAWYGIAFPEGAPPTTVPVHPTQLYEIVWLLAIGIWLWGRRKTSPFLFGEYLLLAGVGRLAIEVVRINPRVAFGLSEAQWIALGMIAVGAVTLVRASGRARAASSIRAG